MLNFNDAEKLLIARLSVPGGWDSDEATGLKRKIRDHFLSFNNPCCCYCRRSMRLWHKITIDTEHVLPKHFYHAYTFDLRNLNISCKRCNMGVKRNDVSFYLGDAGAADPFKSDLYSIIHPNSDINDSHLHILTVQRNNDLLLKYTIVDGSFKGEKTYDYFRLKELEVNSFDEAQDLSAILPSDTLPLEVIQKLETLDRI